ncbi:MULTISPECIES: ABC transporter substrate-binding protein [unclassified Granulicatella]|uniref:ABC transporter substrate-binding protein n=1 Tax=unclassified Granulicatella TaxID=2630493 RepID=UPI0010746E2B|nr:MULTISPECIES: ABC transporter substrate-binding protein [unclassified Granulicatella]MBF0779636.1 ABC transporter substrate-binding protein [Granulicatella sp. 19428wC4_WM01]TFU96294.1 ABC transporter substrate-binding protein [Granulicatella sp. WM01]
MRKKKIVSVIALATLVLAGCSSAANTKSKSVSQATTITIGTNLELSGKVASYGTPMLDAIQLAVEEKNASGGVLGKQIELVKLDNKSDTKESASVATSLTEKNVVGILGPATTADALAQVPVATKAKTPVVLPAATGDNVIKDSSGKVLNYIYRVAYSDSFQGKALATFADETLHAKKVVLLKDTSSDYAKGLSEAFVSNYSGEIVATENFQAGDKDFNAILTKLKTLDYDVLLVAGYYEEAGLIIKQARTTGIDKAILGGDGFASDTLVELAGAENVNKVFYTNHFTTLSTDAKVQNFLKAYREKYNKEADAFAALAYDASGVLISAIETAGEVDTQKITEALANVKNYEGVTGKFSIDENHNVVKSTYVLELVNGKETSYTIVNPK